MSNKITCSICKNEANKFCTVKKIGVHLNKRRDCDKFILAESKVKPKHIIQTVDMTYAARERLRAELKAVEEQAKHAHPLTGDLSRFTSTATKGE